MSEKIFDAYSAYYDLLYQDKDYEGETAFVLKLLAQYSKTPRTVLDLGCGSGRHAVCVARQGIEVTGVELSASMHARAVAMRSRLDAETARMLDFLPGDARTVRVGRLYDAVTALFHVASYQTSNADLTQFFATAAAHLQPAGLFLFDCWYGPAVLTSRPEQKIKEVRDDAARVIRFTRPTLRINENIVDVHFRVLTTPSGRSDWHEFEEAHSMRYLFLPEINALLAGAGLSLVAGHEFLTGNPLGDSSWNACFVARKS